MVTKKTVYEARDGTQHAYKDAAETYEGLLDIYEYVDKNPIYCGSSEHSVDGQAFGLWLREHKSIFVKFLHGGEYPQGDEEDDG